MGATSGQYWRWMGAFIDMHDRLRHIGKPTIARIMASALAATARTRWRATCRSSSTTPTSGMSAPEHGSVPAGGATQWLPLIVGDRRAREIIMLCEPIPPAVALEWGLVSRVAARADLDATVADLAANLVRKLPEALRYTKTQLNWWRDMVWSQTVQHARDWLPSTPPPTRRRRPSPPSTRSDARSSTPCAASRRATGGRAPPAVLLGYRRRTVSAASAARSFGPVEPVMRRIPSSAKQSEIAVRG